MQSLPEEKPLTPEQKREALKRLLRRKAAEPRIAPLSLEQRRLLTVQQLDPESFTYNLLTAYRIEGALRVPALRRGLTEIVRRHDVLRTVFETRQDENGGQDVQQPVQIVHELSSLVFAEIDLRALPKEFREERARAIALHEVAQPFDLSNGPLYRFSLLRLEEGTHLLVLVLHHIIADAWSFQILTEELAALYGAFSRGEASPLPPLTEQFGDFAAWQHRQFPDELLESETSYWEKALAGMEVTELPEDLPRPPLQTGRGATHAFRLPQRLLDGLARIARDHDASPFLASLAVFHVLLQRSTGNPDVNCGIPVSNRAKSEAERLIGFFVNTVVLRADLSGNPSFGTVLERLKEAARGVYAHSHVPFDRLVEKLKPRRDTSRNPLYQITFQRGDLPPLRLEGLTVGKRLEQDYGIVRADLEVYVVDDGRVLFVYNRDLYQARTIENLGRRFQRLWEGIVAAPGSRIGDLPLMSDAERQRVLVEWNDTAAPYAAESCIHELFERQVAREGEAAAAVYEGAEITYAELNSRANRLAHFLRAHGVGPEVTVGIRLERSLDMLAAILAVLKAGGAYVPISRQQPADRLAAILADSGVRLVLTGPDATDPELAAFGTAGQGRSFVDLSALDLAGHPATDPAPLATGRNLAYAIYTSGSTGQPKGVLIEHRSAINLGDAMERLCYHDLGGRRIRASLNAPIEFDASMQQIILLARGHCLVIVPEETRLDGPAFVRYLAEHRVEALDCTPSHLAVLIEAGLLDDPAVRLRKILAAGGAIDRRMWDRLAVHERIDSYDIYGPTECTVNATGHPITTPEIAPRIGGPLRNYSVYLLDAALEPVPEGIAGEIYIGGEGVARGYLARPDLTATAFVPDPFATDPGGRLYRTGDFARILDDDTLEFLGRRDDQVKIRGFRIELGEIHAGLLEHAGVRKAAVVVHGEGAERMIVAYVVPETPDPRLVEDLFAALRRRFPDYMIPARLVVLDELPLTPSGKLDRAGLPRPQAAPAVAQARSPLEESLIEIWADAFGVDRSEIGIHSGFFDLGGHSLLATRITSRMRDVLEVEMPPRLVLSHPTPGELARVVADLRGTAVERSRVERRTWATPPPLSFAQERIWFLDQLEPGLAAYNIPIALRLEGALDAWALEQSFLRFARRHAVLRTSFAVQDGQPVQRIAPDVESFAFPRVDLTALDAGRRQEEVRRRAAEDAALPFDLATGPFFRTTLLRLDGAEHVLLLAFHHIATDAWSIRLLMRELSALYMTFHAGAPDLLDEPPVTYADYAAWQREVLQGEVMEEHLRFWRSRLDAEPPVLNLPMDRSRPPVFRYRGSNVFFRVPAGEVGALVAAARESRVTVFMFLTAAVQLLLARYGGEDDVWLGSPVANRGRSELEGIVGLFINMVVLRGDLHRGQTVRGLLHQARRVILDATDHQDLPFERLVDALNPDRSLSYSPLFQCMLTFQSQGGPGLELNGVASSLLPLDNRTAKLDLTFDLDHAGDHLEGRIEYNTDIFDQPTILRLAGGFRTLLREMAERQEARLGELSLLSPAERFQLVREWNDTRLEPAEDLCMHQLFERRVAEKPERIAVVCGGTALSYGELNERANRIAHFLLSRCAPKARVGIYLRRTPDMVAAVMGVLKAGMTYVPLDLSYPQDRMAHILATSRAELVLTGSELETQLPPADAGIVLLDRETFPDSPAGDPAPQADPDDLAYVIFTSGSTGNPKGVVLQHRPVVNLIEWVNQTFAVGEGDGLLFVTSLCFDLSVYDIFGTLAAGATIHVADDEAVRDPEMLVELLYTSPITFWDSAPAALYQLRPFFDAERGRDSRLRLVFLSGDWIPLALPPAVTETFPRVRVIGLGGATEAAIWSNVFPIGEIDTHWKSIPYGRPIRNARYLVLDAELQPCPVNVSGDLYIGDRCLSVGYLGQPVQTARQYVPDPFGEEPGAVLYATGDRARWRSDGNIEFLGRMDAQVKIRGFRIELGEIEAVLEGCPAVQKAVVLARADRPGERRLVAYVQPRKGEEREEPEVLREELQRHLASKLPEYMIPAHLLFLAEWPVTSNGKLDRKALPAPGAVERIGGSEAGESAHAAESAEQEALARIWAEVLGLERVGVHDNFFNLGGDSILAIQIVARAGQAGLRIRPRDFFQAQSVAAMLPRALEGSLDAEHREPEVGETGLTPIQHWFFARDLADPDHFNQAVLLEWKQEPDVPRLIQALRRLCAEHDAFRLRFFPTEGGWRQAVRPADAPNLFSWIQVELEAAAQDLGPEALDAFLDAAATDVQGSLRLTEGPLVAACLFVAGAGQPQRLLLAVHHLAVDGVSWRILLEDLAACYNDLPIRGRSASWMSWADRLQRPEVVDGFLGEEDFWLRQRRRRELPRDFSGDVPGGRNLAASTGTVVARLSREETELLERRVPDVYRTNMVDVLLAALLRALGEDSLIVDLESHGRSEQLADADLSRTVGWFTSIYPVAIEAARSASPGELLKTVKEQLRAVPREGVGHGVLRFLSDQGDGPAARLAAVPGAEILFNYLGRFGQGLTDNELFRVRTEPTGQDAGGENERSHLLEINSLNLDGVLETRWRFSREIHRAATVERWVERFLGALREILAHCLSPEAGGRTPSDFPLARIDQAELDLLLAQVPALEDLYPATAMQQGMLFHGELEPDTPVYMQQVRVALRGALDLDSFKAAWRTAIERHACLRTIFRIAGGRYLQAVLSAPGSFWRLEDWRGLAATDREDRLERFAAEDLERRFRTAEEPPFRVTLVRLGEEVSHLVVTFHHAILDGWSLSLLFEEVSEIYQARGAGRLPELQPARPLRDYMAWLAGRETERSDDFWRRYLAGFRKPNALARATKGEDTGQHSRRLILPAELVARLDRYSREHRLTRSTVFQAAWALLVGRVAGADDVVVGVTTSGREQGLPGIDRMLGLFINTLPLRVTVGEETPVGDWLQEVQGNLLEIRQRDDSSLAEVQASSELPPGQPLFETIVVVENYPFSEALVKRWLGHTVEGVRTHERASFPLSLLVELRSEVTLEINYEGRSFDGLTVHRMLLQLENLLEQIARGEGRSLGELDLLREAERHQLAIEANDTTDLRITPGCLHERIERQAAATPDRVAVVAGEVELRYAELVERFDRLARFLRHHGVAPGDRVGLWMERSADAIVALCAVLKTGAAYVPVDLEYPAERVETMLRDSGARWVLTRGRELASRLSGICPETRVFDLDELEISEAVAATPLGPVDPAQPAYVIYTSGSTGTPKGVVIEHRSVLNLLDAMIQRVYAGREEGREGGGLRLSVNAPFAFDASMQQIAMLCRGHSLCLVPAEVRRDGAAFVDFLSERRVEGLDITPSHLGLLLEAGLLARTDLALRRVVVAGGAVDAGTWSRLAASTGARFYNIYGPTEATVNATGRPIDGASAVPTIGRPLANYRAFVLDPAGRLVPMGVAGQLFLGGPGLAQGYHARPDLTAERFVPDPFSGASGTRLYATGDLVRILDNGELEYLGRMDHQVKLRGFRVELEEIEAALLRHDGISRAAVVVERSEGSGADARLVAFYTSREGVDLPREELRAFLRRSLPEYMVPGDLLRLETFPLLASGKVARHELPRIGALQSRRREAPSNPAEERIAAMWAEVLGADTEGIGVSDDFLSLGGHSLNAVLLLSRMQRELGTGLSLKDLYEGTTIREIAAGLADEETDLLASDRALELLGELGSLSPEEIQALLAEARQGG